MSKPLFDVAPLPGYPVEYGTILALMQDGTREWRDELQGVSEDEICWQPFDEGYSIGAILLHIAEAEAFWVERFSLGRKLPAEELQETMSGAIDQDNVRWPVPPRKPLSYFFAIQDRIRARTLESVRQFDPPETQKEKEFGILTLRWVLAHVAEHDSYHGGQAVMLKQIAQRSL